MYRPSAHTVTPNRHGMPTIVSLKTLHSCRSFPIAISFVCVCLGGCGIKSSVSQSALAVRPKRTVARYGTFSRTIIACFARPRSATGWISRSKPCSASRIACLRKPPTETTEATISLPRRRRTIDRDRALYKRFGIEIFSTADSCLDDLIHRHKSQADPRDRPDSGAHRYCRIAGGVGPLAGPIQSETDRAPQDRCSIHSLHRAQNPISRVGRR